MGVLLGLLGIAAAIYIPLKIEALKRPKLRIEWAADANNPGMFGGPTRIAHIAIINEPIEGWLGKWLLRNPATGCQVKLSYRSRSRCNGSRSKMRTAPRVSSSSPTPRSFPTCSSTTSRRVAAAASSRSPSSGTASARRMPLAGCSTPPCPMAPLLTSPSNSPNAYEVTVEAETGGIECSARFLLHNDGDNHTDLRLDRDPI